MSKYPSIVEIKSSLPKKCFEKDLRLSFYYVAKDIFIIASLYASFLYLDKKTESSYFVIRAGIYLGYWILQSTMFAAIFVLGHDCGHGSFSDSRVLNDILGNILHTTIMAPYYPWKISHKVHHKNTNNIEKDEVFYPIPEKEVPHEDKRRFKSIPFFGFGIGWFGYIIKGYGHTPTSSRRIRHFNPFDKAFKGHNKDCLISLILLTLWVLGPVISYGKAFGFDKLTVHYLIPVFGFGCWIVLITFLHHHDKGIVWFPDDKWTYVEGQLSSIDRDYGWAHGLIHNIGTHQIHHLFPQIPHYRLEDATKVFRQKYPELVRVNSDPIIWSYLIGFLRFNKQEILRENNGVYVFQDRSKYQ